MRIIEQNSEFLQKVNSAVGQLFRWSFENTVPYTVHALFSAECC